MAGDTQSFSWFSPPHNVPFSQLSSPPVRNSCFSPGLSPAPVQTPGRREGPVWPTACNPSISARQARLGLHLPPGPQLLP